MRRVAVGPATLELLRGRRVEQAQIALTSGVSLVPDALGFSHRWKDDGERCAELLPIRDWLFHANLTQYRAVNLLGMLGIQHAACAA